MIFEYSNYRSFLKDILSGKQNKSPGFSMRAFALKIGLSQSTLSQVLSGKKNLSWESALRIAEKLKFSPIDTEYLALLVRLETAKDPGLGNGLESDPEDESGPARVRSLGRPVQVTVRLVSPCYP